MNVTLIEYTPNPEKIVAAAAKLCYSDSGCENIMEGLDNDKTAAFVKMLSDMLALPLESRAFHVLCWLRLQDIGTPPFQSKASGMSKKIILFI